MIVTVGSIAVDITVANSRVGEPTMRIGHGPDDPVSRFAGGETNRVPVRLSVTPVSGSSWNEILTPEDLARVRHIARELERRFPFTGVTYGRTGGRRLPVKAESVSLPLLAAFDTGDVSVIPLAGYIVAVDHRLGRADALVRVEEDRGKESPLGPVLQAVLALFAPDYRALMLHAASLVLDSGGYLFVGNSGAGKSTIARAVDPGLVLSDDGSWCSQNDGTFSLFPTPFSQVDPVQKPAGPAPLARILFLEKGTENRIADLSSGRAMTMLLSNHIHFFRFMCRSAATRAFGLAGELCRTNTVSMLVFTRNFKPIPFFRGIDNEAKKAV